MRHCIAFALATLSAAVLAAPAVSEESGKAKILFIGVAPDHPYGSHMYMHTCGVLARCVELSPGIETVVSKGWPTQAETLQGVDAIVLYTNPAAELLLDAPHRDEFARLMRSGVGLVTIHWSSTVRQDNLERLGPAWLGYLGGTWVSNVGLSGGKSTLQQLVPEHPIGRGWREYEIEDEYYLNPIVKDATPFLQVREKGGADVIVGWVYERPDGGRSFATTLGHPYRNFQIEAFRKMLANAILWSAKREIPEEGAPVHLSDAELSLPPKP
jgi:type 1 glutamine amidotransferase